MKTGKDFFRYLISSWKVERVLGDFGYAIGTAQFFPQASDRLLYREDMEVSLLTGSHLPYEAYREYLYVYDGENDMVSQHFTDGVLFCNLFFEADSGMVHGVHKCGMDSYKVIYKIQQEDRFSINYQITGPQKRYTIETGFTRIKK